MTAHDRRPEWLRKKTTITGEVARHKARIAGLGLQTICESGRCPNQSECFQAGNATFLVMGTTCTRGSRNVDTLRRHYLRDTG